MTWHTVKQTTTGILGLLDALGLWLPQLAIRLLLAHEFWVSGLRKLHGENWFTPIRERFPFPFDVLPSEAGWQIAIWLELLGALGLLLGLGTRVFGIALSILTLVAIAAVHAGHGYNVCAQGWQLPLIYLVLLLPLIFSGPGRLSVDHWVRMKYLAAERRIWA